MSPEFTSLEEAKKDGTILRDDLLKEWVAARGLIFVDLKDPENYATRPGSPEELEIKKNKIKTAKQKARTELSKGIGDLNKGPQLRKYLGKFQEYMKDPEILKSSFSFSITEGSVMDLFDTMSSNNGTEKEKKALEVALIMVALFDKHGDEISQRIGIDPKNIKTPEDIINLHTHITTLMEKNFEHLQLDYDKGHLRLQINGHDVFAGTVLDEETLSRFAEMFNFTPATLSLFDQPIKFPSLETLLPSSIQRETITELQELSPDKIKKDRETLGQYKGKKIREIFSKTDLIIESNGKTPGEKLENLGQETISRIAAYTKEDYRGQDPKGLWLTLDYHQVGGEEHNRNIGLGEILLSPQIKSILVKTKGREITGIRLPGKRGFYDKDNPTQYIATFTGDQFMIIEGEEIVDGPNQSKQEKLMIEKAENQAKVRAKFYDTYKPYAVDGLENTNIRILPSEPVEYRQDMEESTGLSPSTIQAAENELLKASDRNKASETIEKKPNFVKMATAVAKAANIPVAPILATIQRESALKKGLVGDGGLAVGLGQFHPPAWSFSTRQNIYQETLKKFTKQSPENFGRDSTLASLCALAAYYKSAWSQMKKIGATNRELTHNTEITRKEAISMRFAFHAIGYHKKKEKGDAAATDFYNKNLKAYEKFASLVVDYQSLL
jgi:hypothetical protein